MSNACYKFATDLNEINDILQIILIENDYS